MTTNFLKPIVVLTGLILASVIIYYANVPVNFRSIFGYLKIRAQHPSETER